MKDPDSPRFAHKIGVVVFGLKDLLAGRVANELTLFPKLQLPGLVRVSLGFENAEAEVDVLIRVLEQIARKQEPVAKGDVKRRMEEFTERAVRRVY